MMADFSRLSSDWDFWSKVSRFTDATTSIGFGGTEAIFKSKDWSFILKEQEGRWIIDEVDDRGHLRSDTANFSAFALAEKYLVWNWASVARSSVGATSLGTELYARGFSSRVEALQLREGIYRLTSTTGDAVLVGVRAVVFSHVMLESKDEIDKILRSDLRA